MRVQARTTGREMEEIARVFAEKLNMAKGPTFVYIPLKGFSSLSVEGGPLYEPETDAVFIDGLKRYLKVRDGIEIIEMGCSMDDAALADSICGKLCKVMAGGGGIGREAQ